MKFGQYYRVLFDPDPSGGGDTPPDPVAPTSQAPASNDLKSSGGVIPLSMHEEEIERVKGALKKERDSNGALSKEVKDLRAKVLENDLKAKKSDAYDTALAALGEDFELPADRVPKVKDFLAKLPDSETLSEEVAGFLDLVKVPKEKPAPIRNPYINPQTQTATPAFTPGQRLTPHQVGQLSKEDFDQYIRSNRVV